MKKKTTHTQRTVDIVRSSTVNDYEYIKHNLISGRGIFFRAHAIVMHLRPSTVPLFNICTTHEG
jgi:hypothetical protein